MPSHVAADLSAWSSPNVGSKHSVFFAGSRKRSASRQRYFLVAADELIRLRKQLGPYRGSPANHLYRGWRHRCGAEMFFRGAADRARVRARVGVTVAGADCQRTDSFLSEFTAFRGAANSLTPSLSWPSARACYQIQLHKKRVMTRRRLRASLGSGRISLQSQSGRCPFFPMVVVIGGRAGGACGGPAGTERHRPRLGVEVWPMALFSRLHHARSGRSRFSERRNIARS